MILTEGEARKKWCPKYQVAQLFGDLTSNRANFGDDCRCIASDCMMWRWTGKCKTGVPITSISKHGATELGYCGLGGKP